MKSPPDRPFFGKLTRELAAMTKRPPPSIADLHAIYVELLYRERMRARRLREKLQKRLMELGHDYFKWPSTEASLGKGGIGTAYFQYRQGPLGYLGYCVGHAGATASKRQELLSSVYSGQLPPINSAEYMAEWGEPKSSARLRKMAESIAAFAKNAKRNSAARYHASVAEWKADLGWLKRNYYDGRYDFQLPET